MLRKLQLHKALLLSAALLSTTACMPAFGRSLVDIDVVDRDTGQWLPETPHRGDTWVAGTPGHRYAVRLTNTSSERVLVVLSVDGVNAVTGETAHPSQAGYVLAPWQSTEIAGWRKSMEDVAQFVFTDLPDSYAARTGRPDNVGVIGVAVFREARPIRYDYPAGSAHCTREWRARRGATAPRANATRPRRPRRPPPSRRPTRPTAAWRNSASAPVTASANGRRSAAPASSAPAAGRRRSPSCATTMSTTSSRWAC